MTQCARCKIRFDSCGPASKRSQIKDGTLDVCVECAVKMIKGVKDPKKIPPSYVRGSAQASHGFKYQLFAADVINARKRRGWSQRTLSDFAGCTDVTIWRIEKGKTKRPQIKVVNRLCISLGLNPVRYLGG